MAQRSTESSPADQKRVSTGLEILDRRLGGGIPTGRVVSLCAPPSSQIELFLYEFVSAHKTLYLSFDQPERMIRENIQRAVGTTEIQEIKFLAGDDPTRQAINAIDSLSSSTNVVVHPHGVIERENRDTLVEFMTTLRDTVTESNSVALLYCPTGEGVPVLRDTTLSMSDIIFEFERLFQGGRIENRLTVSKFRGGSAPAETIKLQITDQIRIDTSRDIG